MTVATAVALTFAVIGVVLVSCAVAIMCSGAPIPKVLTDGQAPARLWAVRILGVVGTLVAAFSARKLIESASTETVLTIVSVLQACIAFILANWAATMYIRANRGHVMPWNSAPPKEPRSAQTVLSIGIVLLVPNNRAVVGMHSPSAIGRGYVAQQGR